MNSKVAQNLMPTVGAEGRTSDSLGWLEDEWDEDHWARIEGGELGHAREELRLAEELYSPDLSDGLLLRLYNFAQSHGDEEPGIWSVVRHKISRLILSRISGGPKQRQAKYKHGFDPKDHALAVEAITNDAIPYPQLLNLYVVASSFKEMDEDWNDDTQFAPYWAPVFGLLSEKILAIMAKNRLGNGQKNALDVAEEAQGSRPGGTS